jgi:uncharacterized protein (TIGR02145 family)
MKNFILINVFFLFSSFFLGSQVNKNLMSKIGSQIWMSENLNVDKFKNGDKIPCAKSLKQMNALEKKGKPAWCYYKYDSKNGIKYGKLYNWKAVTDPRGLAPEGWHIPSKNEWEILTNFLGDEGGEKLKSQNGWEGYKWLEKSPNGSDVFNFMALPGGRKDVFGNFEGIGETGFWWTSSQVENDEFLYYYFLQSTDNKLHQNAYHNGMFLSVRCIKN